MTEPDIFIGTPVFRGSEYLSETLHCIQRQTYPHFTVNICIDGEDPESLVICQQFEDDPRFRIKARHHRVGWVENLNQLMRDCDTTYFCYWQQDDFALDNYLEELRNVHLEYPDSAATFADIQWFGSLGYREEATSVLGSRLERVLEYPQHLMHPPLRGLIRAALLADIPLIAPLTSDHTSAEFGFQSRLISRGSFRRTDQTLYFKRAHPRSAHADVPAMPPARRLRSWIAMGAEMLDVALAAATPEAHPRVMAALLDTLCIPRPGRNFLYLDDTPGGIARFVHEFFGLTGRQALDPASIELHDPNWAHRPVHPEILAAMQQQVANFRVRDQVWRQATACDRTLPLATEPLAARAFLGAGWSESEPSGTWSKSDMATLYLPTASTPDLIVLHGYAFGRPGSLARIGWRSAEGEDHFAELQCHESTVVRIPIADIESDRKLVTLLLPDGISPSELDPNTPDERELGFFLSSITFKFGNVATANQLTRHINLPRARALVRALIR